MATQIATDAAAECALYCFAQSGNFWVDWNAYSNIRGWLARVPAEARWVHPYHLMPGHPRSKPA